MSDFTWLPANRATAEDVETVFATGGARKCRCQALKVPGWIWRDTTQEERDAALLEQTACGTAGPTSGLIGYVDGEPAGWVAVEKRENYPRLWSRKQPWMRMAVFCGSLFRRPMSLWNGERVRYRLRGTWKNFR